MSASTAWERWLRVLRAGRGVRPRPENVWQRALRHGVLDLDDFAHTVRHDFGHARRAGLSTTHTLAVTCLDRVGDSGAFVQPDRAHADQPPNGRAGLVVPRSCARSTKS